ncbi:MAG: hypothetical protein GF417_00895, partial [Candidatus Latescibacteria bacterium]|nr:hypothetical protein [bacterium]MBD3422983.1 hypothetical protein [Candidatus Latescibacterota bacterium]
MISISVLKKCGIRRTIPAVLTLFIIIISLQVSSCRRLAYSTVTFDGSPEDDLQLKAHILSDPEEINQLFHSFLPDSGILPVQVGVRNNSDGAVIIQGSPVHGLKGELSGFELIVDSGGEIPLTPMEVVSIMKGESSSGYRRKGVGRTTAGIIFPPLGAYYIYDEATVGRLFRPLTDRSFFCTRNGFFFD